MRHFILQFAAACALSAISIATAFAHASLEKGEAPIGSYRAVLRIPHGCDGLPTNTVRIEIPEGYVNVRPMPKAGWTLDIESGDYARPYKLHGSEISSGPKTVTWSGGNLEDAHFDEFVLSGSLAGVEPGQMLYFVTTQYCANGEVSWNEIAADGQDPHSLDHPAPSLIIAAASGGEHDHGAHVMAGDVVTAGDLEITSAWARAMLPNQPAGGGYLVVTNKGDRADLLVGGSTPAAGKVEIHTMEIVNDVMTMRPVDGGLEIPAGGTVELKPGGLHMMFLDVAEPFEEGNTVVVTLEFENAGKVEVPFPVKAGKGGGHDH